MKLFIVILLTGIFAYSNAQSTEQKPEKVKIKDTINVTNYFMVKPYVFYNMYLRKVICEGNYYLNSSINNTFINKQSYGVGADLIRKIKKMQYGISFKYIYTQENYGAKIIFDDGKDSIYTSHSQLTQLGIGLYIAREFKLNQIKVVPSMSVNYNRNIASNARFLIRDSQNLPNYKSIDIDNLYSKYTLTGNLGCEIFFFCRNRISPFVGYQYMQSFTKEAQQGIFDIKIIKHSNLFLAGLIYKI